MSGGRRAVPILALVAAALAAALLWARWQGGGPGPPAAGPAVPGPAGVAPIRPLDLARGGWWNGRGVAYGPHRDGQRPGGPGPTRAQLREDLGILSARWSLVRVYGADETSEAFLALVREAGRPVRVLLGAALEPERDAAAQAANARQVEAAIRLASAYPDVVLAVVVGNETQVTWSAGRLPAATLVGWIRKVRAGVAVPVATADDFAFWLSPEAPEVARELDLLLVHVHPMWNGQQVGEALAFTRAKLEAVAARFPERRAILGEAGWATAKLDEGDQGKLIQGEPGEGPQAAFLAEFEAWTAQAGVVATWFEAFDENWKGGPKPDEVEKHWGLYRADRTAKRAMLPGAPRPLR